MTTPDLDLVEYVVIAVPELSSTVDVAAALRELVESSRIRILEDRWAQLLADAARTSGGRIIGGERIPRHRLEQARRPRPGEDAS